MQSPPKKVILMVNLDCNSGFEGRDRLMDSLGENLEEGKDLMMEQILENIHTTPIGQVLKKIASLPDVRRRKVLDVRRQLTEGRYDLNERLDVALEKVLEDLAM